MTTEVPAQGAWLPGWRRCRSTVAARSRSRARWQSPATALTWPVLPVRGQCSLPHGHQLIELAQVDLIGMAGLATQSARADRNVVGTSADQLADAEAPHLGTITPRSTAPW